MLRIINIKSSCDDGYIISGNGLCVEHGAINITGYTANIVLNDDGKITIPTGNYELLLIDTDCGDFVIGFFDDFLFGVSFFTLFNFGLSVLSIINVLLLCGILLLTFCSI